MTKMSAEQILLVILRIHHQFQLNQFRLSHKAVKLMIIWLGCGFEYHYFNFYESGHLNWGSELEKRLHCFYLLLVGYNVSN